ncbi:MAG: hypothetical protein AABX66_00510 [Nanoarchaeota archaeon]
MSDDYGMPERRKNRNDKRAKRRFMMFRKGGQHRVDNVNISGNEKK